MKRKYQIIMFTLALQAAVGVAEELPEQVFGRYVSAASAGKTNDAADCCLATNDAQRGAVSAQCQKEVPLIAAGEVTYEAVQSFVDSDCAMVAVLELHTNNLPPECKASWCWMVRYQDSWRMIAGYFKRNDAQREAFQRLVNRIASFEPELNAKAKARDIELKDAWRRRGKN